MAMALAGFYWMFAPLLLPVITILRRPRQLRSPWLFWFCGAAVSYACLCLGMFVWILCVRVFCRYWYADGMAAMQASLSITMPDFENPLLPVALAIPLLFGTLFSAHVLRKLATRAFCL